MCFCLQTNTFQALLVTDGHHSFVIFNHLDDGINWNKGEASTVPAQVGFNSGGAELNSLTLLPSRMENVTNIDTVSNINIPGQFVIRIDDIMPPPGCSNTIGMQNIHQCHTPVQSIELIPLCSASSIRYSSKATSFCSLVTRTSSYHSHSRQVYKL